MKITNVKEVLYEQKHTIIGKRLFFYSQKIVTQAYQDEHKLYQIYMHVFWMMIFPDNRPLLPLQIDIILSVSSLPIGFL